MRCPKCHGPMRSYVRNGVHIEQCDSCRGIFLDYGELESLSQIEGQWYQAPPAPPPAGHAPPYGGHAPAWGSPHYQHRRRGMFHMLFSS
jgi:uncharacterized protein